MPDRFCSKNSATVPARFLLYRWANLGNIKPLRSWHVLNRSHVIYVFRLMFVLHFGLVLSEHRYFNANTVPCGDVQNKHRRVSSLRLRSVYPR